MAEEKIKGIVAEFKEFIARGNVIDMAVGIIMGGAFTPIVNSLVNDIVMPCVGMITGGIDFSDKRIILKAAVEANEAEGIAEAAEVAVRYGNLIQVVINFLIISLCVFVLIKTINKFHKKEDPKPAEPEPPKPTNEELLLTEIRDIMKQQSGIETAETADTSQ